MGVPNWQPVWIFSLLSNKNRNVTMPTAVFSRWPGVNFLSTPCKLLTPVKTRFQALTKYALHPGVYRALKLSK